MNIPIKTQRLFSNIHTEWLQWESQFSQINLQSDPHQIIFSNIYIYIQDICNCGYIKLKKKNFVIKIFTKIGSLSFLSNN